LFFSHLFFIPFFFNVIIGRIWWTILELPKYRPSHQSFAEVLLQKPQR
jgi:hypothetical protein